MESHSYDGRMQLDDELLEGSTLVKVLYCNVYSSVEMLKLRIFFFNEKLRTANTLLLARKAPRNFVDT